MRTSGSFPPFGISYLYIQKNSVFSFSGMQLSKTGGGGWRTLFAGFGYCPRHYFKDTESKSKNTFIFTFFIFNFKELMDSHSTDHDTDVTVFGSPFL